MKKQLKAAVVERFATGKTVTSLGLAHDLGYSGKHATGSNGAYVRLQGWRDANILTMQRARRGPGESPHIFNFTGRPIQDSTLADALLPFLADESLADWEKSAARSACRFILDLPRKCSVERIVEAARTIPAADLHGLPVRAYDLSLAVGLTENTAETRRTALRSLLRHGASHDHISMVFPGFRDEDPWEVQALRYFPLESQLVSSEEGHGLDAQTRATHRTAFRLYGRGCQLAFGEDGVRYADPADISVEELEKVRVAIKKSGEGHRWAGVGSMLNWIGKQHRVGPRVGAPGGRRHPDYLYPEEGVAVSTYDGFLALFDHHAFPAEFRRFFEVYRLMNTLPFDDLEARAEEIPPRRRADPLKDTTLMDHSMSIRHWLGIAVHRLNMRPQVMSLDAVFGRDFSKILAELKRCWAEKAADPNRHVSARTSGGLHAVVVHAGLVAYALWRYRGHSAGRRYQVLVGKRTHVQLAGLNRTEEGEAMAEDHRVLFKAYLESRRQAEAINTGRRNVGRMENVNTVKDLREIFERTPPSFWVAILDEMVARADEWQAAGRDDDDFHEEVLAAMIHGTFIAAGARGAELTHIRQDRHYPPERWDDRVIDLWQVDRKNKSAHELCLWEAAPPRRIEQIYRERTRPFFMAKTGATHEFFFVDTHGQPWGCLEEGEDGTGRDGISHRNRINSMRAFWRRKAAAAAVRAKLEIPAEDYGFTIHDMRGVFGLLIFHAAGLEWAMNYTGDRSPETVMGYYTALKARGIAAKERAILKQLGAPPMLLRASGDGPEQLAVATRSGPDLDGYKARFAGLRELRKMGALTEDEYEYLLLQAKKAFGITRTAA